MAIEKGLYAAPQGIEELAAMDEGPEIEIEIEDPEAVRVGADGEELFSIEQGVDEEEFNKNLAEDLDESVLQQIASELAGDFDDDVSSRKDWIQTYVNLLS